MGGSEVGKSFQRVFDSVVWVVGQVIAAVKRTLILWTSLLWCDAAHPS